MARQRKQPETVQINVNTHHIDWALQQKSTLCAFALALRDMSEDVAYPKVDQTSISWSDRRTGMRYKVPTPPKVAEWIDRFDRQREAVAPVSVVLNLDEATATPMRHQQPSEAVAKWEANQRQKVKRARASVPAKKFGSRTNRELRPVEVTGLVDG